MLYEIINNTFVIIKVKWRARFKLVLIDYNDFEKVKDKKWTYFNYNDSVGYNVKKASKKRIITIEEHILPDVKQENTIIHLNKNRLDNRKENLRVVTHFYAQEYTKIFTEEAKQLLESYNEIINNSTIKNQFKEQNIKEIPNVIEKSISIKKPKIKEINIEGIEIPATLKEFLYYKSATKERSDYFYLIGHPLVLEKLNKRRLQGTKSKSLSTKEKLEQLVSKLNEINLNYL